MTKKKEFYNQITYRKKIHINDPKSKPNSFEDFVSDLKIFDYFYEIFSRSGLLNKKYSTHLDVGGAEGFFGYLCKSLNIVDKTTSIDPIFIEEDKFQREIFYYKFLIRNLFSKYLKKNRFIGKLGYVNKNSNIYNKLPIFKKTNNLITSTEDIYKHKKKYDLITFNFSFENFDPPKMFSKIYSLLNKGGIAYINCSYWWYVINSTKIYSDKYPYLIQRFSKNKAENILKKENFKFFKEKYNYFHQGKFPFTIEDYYLSAIDCGFKIVSSRRNIPSNEITKNSIFHTSPSDIKRTQMNKILIDIRKKNKRVTLEDLYTFSFCLILKK